MDPTQISPRTRECRRKEDVCDLAEYCDGKSNKCPEDVFAVNGLRCDGDQGYCYNGECPQRPKQCIKLYGRGECPVLPCICCCVLYSTYNRIIIVILSCHQVLQRLNHTALTITPEEPTTPSANVPQTTSTSPVRESESQHNIQ